MKNLRRNFERFCYENRKKGIPNLMLYVSIGSAIVYLMSMFGQTILYELLCFDRDLILAGQVWRLFSYIFTFNAVNILMTAVGLVCYFSLGRAMENAWGTFKFNLFYLSGILLMDIYCMIFGGWADVSYLNMSLFLAYATMYPDATFLFMFFIPLKAWIFALVDLALTLYSMIMLSYLGMFPYNLFPLVALANYFLFFGKDVVNVIPISWRANFRRIFRKKSRNSVNKGPIPFYTAGSYQAAASSPKAPYTHRCTVCGRTDVSDPQLEFRYCSRCNGYYCYCQEHISNHTHIE